jgi:uncharacterized protein with HEPN domain
MQHRDKICLQKIIKEIDIGQALIGESTEKAFLENEMLKRAVSMTVINVGELIKNVTDELRQSHSEVPWKAAAGMRDITAHRYQTLRMEDVYMTATQDFTKLRSQLETILKETETEENHVKE